MKNTRRGLALTLAATLTLLGLLLFAGDSAAVAAAPSLTRESWLATVARAYRAHQTTVPDFPADPSPSAPVRERLQSWYATLRPSSIEAVSLAYWGALRSGPHEQPLWVERMTRARDQHGAATEAADSREFLPEALEALFLRDQTTAPVRALVGLEMDGGYAETLNGVRFGLFLRFPEAFAVVLRERGLESLRRDIHASHGFSFTGELVSELQYDRKLRHDFQRLRETTHGTHSTARFLTQYLALILAAATVEEQPSKPPHSAG